MKAAPPSTELKRVIPSPKKTSLKLMAWAGLDRETSSAILLIGGNFTSISSSDEEEVLFVANPVLLDGYIPLTPPKTIYRSTITISVEIRKFNEVNWNKRSSP